MLVIDEFAGALGRHRSLGRLAGQPGDAVEPWNPALRAVLPDRRHVLRAIEAAERDIEVTRVEVAERQRRAAKGAELAHRQRRAGEQCRRSAGPGEIALLHRSESGERSADRLLAHAAMAEMNPLER